ncbi:MAG: prevent-host-death family protein [Candidatus Paceibacterota bacterium]
MQKLLTTKTISLTELRDPKKFIEAAGDSPVAIMNRNKVVGYFVPEAAAGKQDHIYADKAAVVKAFVANKKKMQPVLDYLKDK